MLIPIPRTLDPIGADGSNLKKSRDPSFRHVVFPGLGEASHCLHGPEKMTLELINLPWLLWSPFIEIFVWLFRACF